MSNPTQDTKATEVSSALELLPTDATLDDAILVINALIVKINAIKIRDRGPESKKPMTETLAR